MSQTAAERATAFAIEKFQVHEKLKAEATRIYAEYEEAKGEFQWAMAHPALPEGFDPAQHAEQEAPAEEAPAPKRRGRPRKTAEPKPEAAATPVAEVQSSAPVAAPVAAPNPAQAPVAQAPVAQAPVATPPAGDFFDPFAQA